MIRPIEQFFEIDDVETTISSGMCKSFKIESRDLERIEATTASLEDEKQFIGVPFVCRSPTVRNDQ